MRIELDGPRAAGIAGLRMMQGLAANPSGGRWAGLWRDPDVASSRTHLKRCAGREGEGEKRVDSQPRYGTAEVVANDRPVLRMGWHGAMDASEDWAGVGALKGASRPAPQDSARRAHSFVGIGLRSMNVN